MKRFRCLWLLVIWNLVAPSVLCWADAPIEEYYVLPDIIPVK